MRRLQALLKQGEEALKDPPKREENPQQRPTPSQATRPSAEQMRAYEVELRVAQMKRQLRERHPGAPEQPPQVGAARVISDEVYKGERLIMLQQGHGWALLRGAEAKEVVHQLEGKGPSAQLTSRAQESGQLRPGAVVRLAGDLKTVWAEEERSRAQKVELERQLKAMQPKRDRGPDR